MARNFENFLTGFVQWSKNVEIPPEFHFWSGISLIAALLERDVFIRKDPYITFPNMYVFLVADPGIGKSSAINPAHRIADQVQYEKGLVLIPEDITTAALYEKLEERQHATQTTGYFIADEGSSSALRDEKNGFTALMTKIYDCPSTLKKFAKVDGRAKELTNLCGNMLVGSTFDFLKRIVNENSIKGGFASRVTYVIGRDEMPYVKQWHKQTASDKLLYEKLLQDALQIYELRGEFKMTKSALDIYLDWEEKHKKSAREAQSENMKTIMARQPLQLNKLNMIMSVARGNDLTIREEDILAALEHVSKTSQDLYEILNRALIADKNSYAGYYQLIIKAIGGKGKTIRRSELFQHFISNGNDATKIASALEAAVAAELIELSKDGKSITLLKNPQNYI